MAGPLTATLFREPIVRKVLGMEVRSPRPTPPFPP